jgi:hypothetical protein
LVWIIQERIAVKLFVLATAETRVGGIKTVFSRYSRGGGTFVNHNGATEGSMTARRASLRISKQTGVYTRR